MILLIHSFFLITSSNSVFFKFQYDSINTDRVHVFFRIPVPFKFQYDSINTIETALPAGLAIAFKFQYDSINTMIL